MSYTTAEGDDEGEGEGDEVKGRGEEEGEKKQEREERKKKRRRRGREKGEGMITMMTVFYLKDFPARCSNALVQSVGPQVRLNTFSNGGTAG